MFDNCKDNGGARTTREYVSSAPSVVDPFSCCSCCAFVLATITSFAVCLGGWLIVRLQLFSPAERELLIVPMLICGLFLLGLSVFIALDSPATSTAE
jgi:hypothetical protein